MFTPKLEVVRVLEIPLVTTTFSPTIISEGKGIPQSLVSPPDSEELYAEVEIHCPNEFRIELMQTLKLYGQLETDNNWDTGGLLVLKNRLDILCDALFDNLLEDVREDLEYMPCFIRDLIEPEDWKLLEENTHLNAYNILINYDKQISEAYEQNMTIYDIVERTGRKVVSETKNLYLIEYN